VLPLLLTLSSGAQGFSTIHAGSARQALSRLRFICQLADTASPLSVLALSSLVTEAVDLVVHCSRVGGVPRVTEVVAVEDMQAGVDAGVFTTTQVCGRDRAGWPLRWGGQRPVRIERAIGELGIDVGRR
jgi:pilus assembly protein CpaF